MMPPRSSTALLMRLTHSPISAFTSSGPDRKSTRLNSSHVEISYAVFCLKKKNNTNHAKELLRGKDRTPFWSPDYSRIAFLKVENVKFELRSLRANNLLTVSLLIHAHLDS